jgi:hypothetical protein
MKCCNSGINWQNAWRINSNWDIIRKVLIILVYRRNSKIQSSTGDQHIPLGTNWKDTMKNLKMK